MLKMYTCIGTWCVVMGKDLVYSVGHLGGTEGGTTPNILEDISLLF